MEHLEEHLERGLEVFVDAQSCVSADEPCGCSPPSAHFSSMSVRGEAEAEAQRSDLKVVRV